MKVLIISSSLDPDSRSRELAIQCLQELKKYPVEGELADLRDLSIPNFDNTSIYRTEAYQTLHSKISEADSLILASPVYNWACCAELKKLIEYAGSTPPDGSLTGAFFDKVVTFVNSAGLPHSYTAFAGLANSMMLDFKCIINPYNLYVHTAQWIDEKTLDEAAQERLKKSIQVAVELCRLLAERNYRSTWEI